MNKKRVLGLKEKLLRVLKIRVFVSVTMIQIVKMDMNVSQEIVCM